MTQQGYVECDVFWSQDEHARSTLFIFGLAGGLIGGLVARILLRPAGALNVTYRRSDVSPAEAMQTPEPLKWSS
jgi:hypothetical protein